ncbi:alkaline shock response membrane anchor protein AmaP [Streptomyces sp. L500]
MLRIVNRLLTGLAGALLVALGAAVLIGALDLPRHWGFELPSAWPFTGPDDVLLPTADLRRWRGRGWWWPAVVAVLAVVVLLSAWWLSAQARRGRLREVVVHSGGGEVASVRGRALEEVMEAEAEELPGVERAAVVLSGRRTAPRARIVLTLGARGAPGVALARLREEVLRHARVSAGLTRLPTEVRLRAVRHRAERVG